MTALNQQRSHTQRIVNMLLSDTTSQIAVESNKLTNGIADSSTMSLYKSDFDFIQEGHRRVLVLLDLVDFSDKLTLPWTWCNLSVLSSFGEPLMEAVCRDASPSPQIKVIFLMHTAHNHARNKVQ